MADDEAAADNLLGRLISDHADPIISQIVSYKLRIYSNHSVVKTESQDAEDLRSEVHYKLILSLQECKKAPAEKPIANFRGYTATTSYHVCSEYLRRKHPRRHSLKSRLRRLLSQPNGLALWKDASGETVAGFSAWRDQNLAFKRTDRYRDVVDHPHIPQIMTASAKGNPAEFVAKVFDWIGGPIEIDDLVRICAELWGVNDQPDQSFERDEDAQSPQLEIADPRAGVDDEVANRLVLKRVWDEVCQLPVNQRLALLLNLRDEKGACVTALLPVTRVATIRQIAEVLELPLDEFAKLWVDLPLDDATIAGLIGLSRQQVINLRKAARERLARKIRGLDR